MHLVPTVIGSVGNNLCDMRVGHLRIGGLPHGRVVASAGMHRARQKAGWLSERSREPDPPQGDQRPEPERASHI